MFKFTKNSKIVKSWVVLINAGTYTIEDVPTFFGLREVVVAVLSEEIK